MRVRSRTHASSARLQVLLHLREVAGHRRARHRDLGRHRLDGLRLPHEARGVDRLEATVRCGAEAEGSGETAGVW